MNEKSMIILKKDLNQIAIVLILSLIIEILICNYPAIRTLIVGNVNVKSDYLQESNKIKIEEIGFRVTNVKITYKNTLTDKITYKLSYSYEGNSDIVNINSKVLLPKDKQCLKFDTRAETNNIEIELDTKSSIEIDNIILNSNCFDFNTYRFILIAIVINFIINIKKQKYNIDFFEKYKENNKIFIIYILILFLITSIYVIYQYDFKSLVISPEEIPPEDSILMQAESLVNKKIELMIEPSEELKNMENPYDSTKRQENNVHFLYDVAYFEGKYYNYFGIAPIILLILPFRLVTGVYLHTYLFNLVFILGILISLYELYKKVVSKYIKNISVLNFYLGYYACVFGSNIFTLLRGSKYDIVVTSGIMFIILSLYLALSVYDNLKYKYMKLVLLGVTTGFIVLSKPNFIVYYPVILIALLINMKENNIEIKNKIYDSTLIAIPLGILAVFQMILNYIRFDNIIEFGAKYQLTGFNMIMCMQFTFGKTLVGLGEYIFKTPIINPFRFPFVFINTDINSFTVNEICYENRLIGLITIPIMWIYIFGKKLFKAENKNLKYLINAIIIVSLLSIIINTNCGGICEAYSIDFKMLLSLGAVLIALVSIKNSNEKGYINRIFLILSVITILIMIPISYTTENNFLSDLRNSQTVFLKNLFEFWS